MDGEGTQCTWATNFIVIDLQVQKSNMQFAVMSNLLPATIEGNVLYTADASQEMGLTTANRAICGHTAPSLEIKYLRKRDNADNILLDIKPTPPLPLASDTLRPSQRPASIRLL